MKCPALSLLLLIPILTGSATFARADQILIDADFAASDGLPKNWSDNTSPTTSARRELSAVDKSPVVRLTREKGDYRLSCPIPGDALSRDAFYRLTITGRSASRAPIQCSLKPAMGKPVWSTRPDLLEVLSDVSSTFHLPPQSQPFALLLTLQSDSPLDLSRIKLTRFTRDELVARMKKDFPKGGIRQNLLRVSRFPLGLQSGSAIGRDRSDEEFTAEGDPAVIGPSGAPAIKLSCPQPLRFFLPPTVIPWTFTQHVASVYLRGHGSGSFSVIADGDPVASVPFSVNSDDQWTRVALPFDPAFLAGEHQLVLDTTGTIHADAFQLEPGDKPTDYVARAEVSLAFPKSDASVARIQFDDDPAVIDFAVTGGANNVLNARVTNIYGQSRALPDIALVGSDVAHGSLQYELFAGRSFGVFRVEAWVENDRGQRISPVNEMVVTRVRRPKHFDEDAPDSPFGLHLGPTHRQMVLAKAIGTNWVRLHDAGIDTVGWSFLEPERGVPFQFQDAKIKRYRDHHLSLLATLSQSPGWASGLGHPCAEYWDRYLEPLNNEDFANYVRTVVEHYQHDINAWDVWNEPWMRFWSKWDPEKKQPVRSPTATKDFAALQHAAYDAVKSVDADSTVLGLNSTGGLHGSTWTKDLRDHDGLSPADAYSYHSYTNELAGFPNDAPERHFHDALGPILKKPARTSPATTQSSVLSTQSSSVLAPATDKPVWMTEGNGTNFLITRGFYNVSAPGEDPENSLETADKLARYESSTLAQGVEKIFLYHINLGGEFRPGPGAYQTLVTDDGYPHPSAAAHAALAWHLEGKIFVKRIRLAEGVFASLFTGQGHSVAVVTAAPRHAPYTPPTGIAMDTRDLFGNDLPDNAPLDNHTTYIDLQGTPADLERALTRAPATKPAVK